MLKILKKYAILFMGIAFFCLNQAQASEALGDQCLLNFKELQQSYTEDNADYTIVSGDGSNMHAYTLNHRFQHNSSYSLWKNLNGEIAGYFLRDNVGFDFNQDRNSVSTLSWHQTHLWDRLLRAGTVLKDYNCMIAGRTRLADRKVTLLRFAPADDLRYSYVIAKDEDNGLPVELNVINPNGNLVVKISSTNTVINHNGHFIYNDEIFDRFELLKKAPKNAEAKPWAILNIPKQFKLQEESSVLIGDSEVAYQRYSDGLTDFRVFRNRAQSLYLPSALNGTLTVLRRSDRNYEYAVVGEVPLQLGEYVLKRLSSHH